MFAMLLAMAFCRAARPATETRSAADERSSNTAAPRVVVKAPIRGGSRAIRRSYPAVRPTRESAERQLVAGRLHARKASRNPSSGVPGRRLHRAVDVDRPFDR